MATFHSIISLTRKVTIHCIFALGATDNTRDRKLNEITLVLDELI